MSFKAYFCVVAFTGLLGLSVLLGQQQMPLPVIQPIPMQYHQRGGETDDYVIRVLFQVTDQISRSYWKPIEQKTLVGRAIAGTYTRFNLPVPQELAKDVDNYLSTMALQEEHIRKLTSEVKAKETISSDKLLSHLFTCIVKTLDPHTHYYNCGSDVRGHAETGAILGVTFEDRQPGKGPIFRNIHFNSLAHKYGIRPGDELLSIMDQEISPDASPMDLLFRITIDAMNTTEQKPLRLKVQSMLTGKWKNLRISQPEIKEAREIQDTRQQNPTDSGLYGYRLRDPDTWDYWVSYSEGYALFRLSAVQELQAVQVAEALEEMQHQRSIEGIILDLRDCPMGYIDGCVNLCRLFLHEGTIVKTHYRTRTEGREYKVSDQMNPLAAQRDTPTEQGKYSHVPLLVLVGPETSGGGELIAAALQDNKRGITVGQRTRGKCTIQYELLPFPNYHSLKLTGGSFSRPSGKNLQRSPGSKDTDEWGIVPDAGMEVQISPTMRRQVRHWWFTREIFNLDDVTEHPLDRLENDPVLYSAISYLRKQVKQPGKRIALEQGSRP